MAGFVRRYGFFPGTETITLIEGVIIVDLPPPGAVQGVGVGTVAVVGEFADMGSATSVDTSGVVTTKAQPVELFSGQDMLNKVGGFDETLGKFGAEGGNGFVALRNKQFSRIIAVPVNLCSAQGARVFRKLPTNTSATNATPVVPMQSATMGAGREFKTASNRVRAGTRFQFGSSGPYAQGIDGRATSAGAAATQPFKDGVVVAIGSLARAASTVTATVGAHNFAVGQTVYLDPGEADFPAGPKVITFVDATHFKYTEAGNAVVSLALETFSSVNFLLANNGGPVKKGDALLVGVIGAAGAQGANADTYRVTADAVSVNQIIVERQDGSTFDWTTGTALAFRVHPSGDADSGDGTKAADAGGYTLPARPLDATISAATLLSPTVAPPAATATAWDPLSGLSMLTQPGGGGGLTFTSTIQAPNAPNDATIDALYATAIDSLLSEDLPARDVNIVYAARTSATIRSKLKSHVLTASGQGVGRTAVIAPPLDTVQSTSAAIADADPGVGANRDERIDYTWPGCRTFVPEAVGFALGTADGKTTSDGILDVRMDGFLAAVMSNLPPERNPGQAGPPVPTVLAPVIGFQRGVSGLGINDYIQYRQKGIAALRIDRTVGPIIQSGITTSLISGQKNINRRRMADFIEDSLSQSLLPFTKLPLTNALKDSIAGEVNAFLTELLSPNNPPAQRINAFQVDDKSGNTPDLEAKGIFVVIARVRTLATADFITIQAEVGEGVQISST